MATAIALGCGLVGQFVVERLLEHGHEVTVVDLQIPEELSSNPMVKALVGDATQHIGNFPPQSVVINMLPGRVGDTMLSTLRLPQKTHIFTNNWQLKTMQFYFGMWE
jgi:saccharopine dehydrogenase-like NADP-dependent oxidoreductase